MLHLHLNLNFSMLESGLGFPLLYQARPLKSYMFRMLVSHSRRVFSWVMIHHWSLTSIKDPISNCESFPTAHDCRDGVKNPVLLMPQLPRRKSQVDKFFMWQVLVKGFASSNNLVLLFLTETTTVRNDILSPLEHQRIQIIEIPVQCSVFKYC